MTSTIHSTREENGRRRVIFSHVHEGRTFGPFVEDRPLAEDPQAFADARGEALLAQISTPDMKAQLRALLDGYVGAGTYDGCAQALAEFGIRQIRIAGNELSITAEAVTPQSLPSTDAEADAAIGTRVDALLGAGKYAAIKSALASQGLSGSIEMVRNAEVHV